MSTRRQDIFWFILLRVIIITTIFISVVTIHYATAATLTLSAFYLIFAAYFLSLVYFLLYFWGKNYTVQVYIQIFFDLLLITALVYFSGGLKGSFYFLYVFEIIAASIVLSSRATYITAILSGVLFAALIDGMYLGIIPSYSSDSSPISMDALITNVFTSWGVFFLVALLISYLTGKLRKTREELERAQKELEVKKGLALAGEISAHLAHEIRNPLAAISGSIQVLRKEIALSGEQRDLMNIVVDESDRISKSIEQFLNLASPGKQTFAVVELSQVLKETITLLQRSEELNGTYRVEGNYGASSIYCYGNSNQFKQIFWNLIKNALKAMPDGGTLTIDLNQRKKNEIELKVKDSGKGMAKEDQERLFEPFYSGFKTGKGIGMAVVRRIVDDYNGKILVSSELDKGTEIVILLPQGSLNKKDIREMERVNSNG
jgi:signal transduction histidine kinase